MQASIHFKYHKWNNDCKNWSLCFVMIITHTHAQPHTVAPYTQNDVNAYQDVFVTSSKWLWNSFERHSIAADNHSKKLERGSAKPVGVRFDAGTAGGWLSINLKERPPSGHGGIFFSKPSQIFWELVQQHVYKDLQMLFMGPRTTASVPVIGQIHKAWITTIVVCVQGILQCRKETYSIIAHSRSNLSWTTH